MFDTNVVFAVGVLYGSTSGWTKSKSRQWKRNALNPQTWSLQTVFCRHITCWSENCWACCKDRGWWNGSAGLSGQKAV